MTVLVSGGRLFTIVEDAESAFFLKASGDFFKEIRILAVDFGLDHGVSAEAIHRIKLLTGKIFLEIYTATAADVR